MIAIKSRDLRVLLRAFFAWTVVAVCLPKCASAKGEQVTGGGTMLFNGTTYPWSGTMTCTVQTTDNPNSVTIHYDITGGNIAAQVWREAANGSGAGYIDIINTQATPGQHLTGNATATIDATQKLVFRMVGVTNGNTGASTIMGPATVRYANPMHVTVSLHNTKDVPITYKLVAKNPLFVVETIGGPFTLQPHTALIQKVTVPAGYTDVQVVYQLDDLQWTDGGGWAVVPGAVSTGTVTVVNSTSPPSVVNDSEPEVVNDMNEPGVPSGTPTSPSSGGSIWNVGANGTGTGPTDGLTNTVYRQGVDKITARLDQTKISVDAVKSSTDAVKVSVDAVKSSVDAVKNALAPSGASAHQDPTADLATSKTKADAVVFTGIKVSDLSSSVPAIEAPTSELASVAIGATTVHFDLSNFVGRPLLIAGRALILAALAVGFLKRSGDDLMRCVLAITVVPQADSNAGPENLIPGVAQAKTWGAAGAITLAVFGVVAALIAAFDLAANGIGGVGVTGILTAVSLNSSFTASLGMANLVFPVYACLAFILLDAARPYYIMPVYLVAAGVVKFTKA